MLAERIAALLPLLLLFILGVLWLMHPMERSNRIIVAIGVAISGAGFLFFGWLTVRSMM